MIKYLKFLIKTDFKLAILHIVAIFIVNSLLMTTFNNFNENAILFSIALFLATNIFSFYRVMNLIVYNLTSNTRYFIFSLNISKTTIIICHYIYASIFSIILMFVSLVSTILDDLAIHLGSIINTLFFLVSNVLLYLAIILLIFSILRIFTTNLILINILTTIILPFVAFVEILILTNSSYFHLLLFDKLETTLSIASILISAVLVWISTRLFEKVIEI